MTHPETIPCPQCEGSGFSGQGTGYGDVCGECGGQREVSVRVPTDPFRTDLEAVFGERAAELSPALCGLLRSLWNEGVKHGRHVERNSFNPVAVKKSRVAVSSPKSESKTMSEMREAMEKGRRAMAEFDFPHRAFSRSRPLDGG